MMRNKTAVGSNMLVIVQCIQFFVKPRTFVSCVLADQPCCQRVCM